MTLPGCIVLRTSHPNRTISAKTATEPHAGNRIADLVAAVHKCHSEGQHQSGGNPNADLRHSNSTTVYSRMKVIEDPKQKKRHPAQQIEMSVRGHRRVILRDGHDDAPDHADPSMWRQRRMLRL